MSTVQHWPMILVDFSIIRSYICTNLDAATMEAHGRVHHDSVFDGDQKLHDFTPLSTEEVKKLIQKASKKSCQHHWSLVWLTNFCPLYLLS